MTEQRPPPPVREFGRGGDKSDQRNCGWVKRRQNMGKDRKAETQLNNLRKTIATVIPAPRKSVKRMMFESFLAFITDLFSSEANAPEKIVGGDGSVKIKRLTPDPPQSN